MVARIEISGLDNLLQRYLAGEPENKLSREAGINRWTFRQRLLKAGIEPRNVSDSMYIRWRNADPDTRAAMLAKAHAACRGRVVTDREKALRAQVRERLLAHAVTAEYILGNLLRTHGLDVTQQKAVGPYNLDVAINAPPIAVEIFGGHWHASGRHIARFYKRTKYLLDGGRHVVIVWVDGRRYPLGSGCADYLVALVDELRGNPPARGQYRVILGNGQPASTAHFYLNSPADIERLRGAIGTAGNQN